MAIALYRDHHVPRAIAQGLRLRGVDVLTALEDDGGQLSDSALLDRAVALDRVLFTQADDLLAEATHRQRAGRSFRGVIYAHQLRVPISRCISDLEIIAQAAEPTELTGEVVFLPL